MSQPPLRDVEVVSDERSYEYDVATDDGQRRVVMSIRWWDGREMTDDDANKALWALGTAVCEALAESMVKAALEKTHG